MGGAPLTAAILGFAMVALQAAIGALNDVVDSPRDMGRPDKPIAAGRVSLHAARRVAALSAALGLALSATAGWATLLVGVAILGTGVAYDLWFKGTAWSWLPFAVGVPLLPVYAAVGSVGGVPAGFGILTIAAAIAGAMLAIGNALADLDADRRAGVTSTATWLGRPRSVAVQAALLAGILVLAAPSIGLAAPSATARSVGASLVALGAAMTAGGLVAMARWPALGRAGWAAEAVGVAVMAAGWVAATLVH